MIFFDTETTGLLAEDNQIAQLSYVKVDNNYNIEFAKNFYFTVDRMSCGAQEIHGLSKKLLEELSRGKKFEDFVDEIYKDFSNDDLLIAHNVRFDKDFLVKEFERLDKDISIFKKDRYFCTMEYYTDILDIYHEYYGVKYPRLNEVIDYLEINKKDISLKASEVFEVESTGYHDSRFDVMATYLIYKYKDIDFEQYSRMKDVFFKISNINARLKDVDEILQNNKVYNSSVECLDSFDKLLNLLDDMEWFNNPLEKFIHCSKMFQDVIGDIELEKAKIKKKKELELKSEIERILGDENTVIRKAVLLKEHNFNELYEHIVFDIEADYTLNMYCENCNVDLIELSKNRYLMISSCDDMLIINVSEEASKYSITDLGKEYKILDTERCPDLVIFPERAYKVKSYNSYLNLPESHYYKDIDKNKDNKLEVNYEPLDDDDIPF